MNYLDLNINQRINLRAEIKAQSYRSPYDFTYSYFVQTKESQKDLRHLEQITVEDTLNYWVNEHGAGADANLTRWKPQHKAKKTPHIPKFSSEVET